MGFWDSGISQGLNQATGTMLQTGMGMMRLKQDQLQHEQALKLHQEKAERERIAFEREEAAIKEKEARDNTVIPASKYFPKIREFPSYRQSLKEGFEALGLPYEETPDGDILGKYGHGKEVMQWIYESGDRAEKQAKGVFGDLQTKKMALLEQLQNVKKPEEAKAINEQLAQLSEQQAQVMGSTWEVQKKMAEEQGKPKTEGAPHTIVKTSPDGKTEQTFQYNPNSTAVDKYDIPIGQPHPVKSQVIGVIEQQKQNASFNTWTPEAKSQEFMEFMITGQPPVNVRGLAGADRQAFGKEFAQWKVDKGFKPQDIALMKADYKAGDISLKNMAKQEAPMEAFVQNINTQVNYAKTLFDKLQRTDIRALNVPMRELRTKLKGSGLEQTYELFMQEISMEANKLAQGSASSIQQLPEQSRKEWLRIHDVNLPLKEILPVLEGTKNMANMRLSTWKEAKEVVRSNIQNLARQNSEFEQFDVKLPGNVTASDIAAELERRRRK
jgi:hypothetical protein